MKLILFYFFGLFCMCVSAQNYNSVYPKYNNTNRTIILVEEKKQSLADVIMQQEYLNILNKQVNINNTHTNTRKDSRKELNEIKSDYKENSKNIIQTFQSLNLDNEYIGNGNVGLLDNKNGFKEIQFGLEKSDFRKLISIDNSTFIYEPEDKGLYSVFDIKSVDKIYLQFGNRNMLDNISLIKNYQIYKSRGVLDIALYDFRSLINNYRALLGKEMFFKIDEDKVEGTYIWESNLVRLIVVGGYDQYLKLKSDLNNEFMPYFTMKIYYYKKNNLEQGI